MVDAVRQYHLNELKIALDRNDPRRILPELHGARRILDIGCGAGQTLIALGKPDVSVGVDIDIDALQLGVEWNSDIHFAAAQGEWLPFRSESFDFVCSRVAVPYMNIPAALAEARRILQRGGHLWLSLHDISMPLERFHTSGWKGKVFALYVILNGLAFHATGRTFRFINGQRESFQTEGAMRRALKSAGFVDVSFQRSEKHFIVLARAS